MAFIGLSVLATLAMAAQPSNAYADTGTIDIGHGSGSGPELEASFEIRRSCGRGGEPSYESTPCRPWFAEASEYPPSQGSCPSSFEASHSIWTSPAEELGFLLETEAFRPRQPSGAIIVCLYVHDNVDGLVGESKFVLTRLLTKTEVSVRLTHGCKINSSVRVNGGRITTGRYWERLRWGRGRLEHADGSANVGEGTEWKKELPGTYQYAARFLGSPEYLPSQASVLFRVYPCSSHLRTIVIRSGHGH
jgi:hypothetical protein